MNKCVLLVLIAVSFASLLFLSGCVQPAVCGDKACASTENYTSCPQDCPASIVPSVVSVSPTNGATNVAVTTAVSVPFNKAMDKAAVEPAFSISPSVTGTFSWSVDGKTMTFTPSAAFAYDKQYTVTISTAAKDLEGNSLQSAHAWSFTTVKAPVLGDTTPPTVVSVLPANGATNVPIDQNISVTFSEAMDQTATLTAFSLSYPNVTGSFSWNVGGTIMEFDPSTALEYNKTYVAFVSMAAKDLAGNNLQSLYSWQFTTAPQYTTPGGPPPGGAA